MKTNKPRFKQRLMRSENEEIVEESGISLKERFTAKEKRELKVEKKPIVLLIIAWNKSTQIIGVLISTLGFISLIQPDLRRCLVEMFWQFFMEIKMI